MTRQLLSEIYPARSRELEAEVQWRAALGERSDFRASLVGFGRSVPAAPAMVGVGIPLAEVRGTGHPTGQSGLAAREGEIQRGEWAAARRTLGVRWRRTWTLWDRGCCSAKCCCTRDATGPPLNDAARRAGHRSAARRDAAQLEDSDAPAGTRGGSGLQQITGRTIGKHRVRRSCLRGRDRASNLSGELSLRVVDVDLLLSDVRLNSVSNNGPPHRVARGSQRLSAYAGTSRRNAPPPRPPVPTFS